MVTRGRGIIRMTGRCVVPKLKGKSLAAAERALKKAHLRRRKDYQAQVRDRLHVTVDSELPETGCKHPAGTKVALTGSRGKH